MLSYTASVKQHNRQRGFQYISLLLLIALAVVGAAVTSFVVLRQKEGPAEQGWVFNDQQQRWSKQGATPPACKDPFVFDRTPVDISQVTSVLLPGAFRGYNYKPHGGFGVAESTQGKVEVTMPTDATLVGLTRYYEGNPPDLQYLLTFETDCGIAFRFDHLYTLSPELQVLAAQTPEPKLNDTRTNPDDNPPRTKFPSGQVIATQVGLPSVHMYGFDFGVYDYRQPNEISKNPQWAALHGEHKSLDWFGVCWYDMLPGTAPAVAKELSLRQTDTRRTVPKVSDYCSHVPYKTLDINGGEPTDG